MKIELSTEKRFETKPAEVKLVKEITIINIVDNYANRSITAITKEVGSLKLWSGSEYEAIGQWTDTDVENRINELINN